MTGASGGSRQDERLVYRGAAFAWSAVCAAVVVALGLLVVREWAPLLDVDSAIERWVHDWALQAPWAVQASKLLGLVGGVVVSSVAAVIVVVVLLIARRWWVALTFGLAAALAPFLTERIKEIVERPRPVWADPLALAPEGDPWSFPSGHATGGIAVWLAIGVALGTLLRSSTAKAWFTLPWAVLGVSIGLSRIVLGLHWPSDVLAGWCVAIAVAALAAALFVLPTRETAQASGRRPPPAMPSGLDARRNRPIDAATAAADAGAGGVLPTAVAEAAPEGAPAPGDDERPAGGRHSAGS